MQKDIVENSTLLGATKIIMSRFSKERTPRKIVFAGKYIMFVEGLIKSVSTGGNPLVVSGTMSAARSIIKDL